MGKPLTQTSITFLFATAALSLAVLITINVPPLYHPPVVAEELVVFPRAITIPPAAITAKAAVLHEPTTAQILVAKNAKESLALASLT